MKVNESTLEVSQAECERARQLLEAGSIAKSDLAQLEAQVRHRQVPTGDRTSHPARLQTTTETTPGTGRRIRDEPLHPHTRHGKRTGTPATKRTLPFCLVLRPEIEAGKLNIQTSDLDIKIARAGYLAYAEPQRRHRNQPCQRQ